MGGTYGVHGKTVKGLVDNFDNFKDKENFKIQWWHRWKNQVLAEKNTTLSLRLKSLISLD